MLASHLNTVFLLPVLEENHKNDDEENSGDSAKQISFWHQKQYVWYIDFFGSYLSTNPTQLLKGKNWNV